MVCSDDTIVMRSAYGATSSVDVVAQAPKSAVRSRAVIAVVGAMLLCAAALVAVGAVGSEAPVALESMAPGKQLSLKVTVPSGETLAPGEQIRGMIGDLEFVGHVKAQNQLKIATDTQSLAASPAPAIRPDAYGHLHIATGTQQLAMNVGPGGGLTFTADSDKSYPPGTVVSGYVNGKFFRGVVQGVGESQASRFARRVNNLKERIADEEHRRGIDDAREQRVSGILARVKALEKRMNDAYAQTRDAGKPTLLAGDVAGFHFHGTMEPAEKPSPKEKPSRLAEETAAQAKLLKRVEKLEKEAKST